MNHLGARVSALVDGQLGHSERDRALAHVAHCATCREAVDAERTVKTLLASSAVPTPSRTCWPACTASASRAARSVPGPRSMPLGPVVPTLPPPGRGPFGARGDSRRPAKSRRGQRVRYAAAGAVSVAGLVLGTAFAAGGGAGAAAVVPPAAELSVEHAVTTSGLPLGDPAFTAVTASFGGLTIVGTPPR